MSKEKLWETKPALWLLSVGQRVRTQCMAHRGEIDHGHALGASSEAAVVPTRTGWTMGGSATPATISNRPTVESART